ncbi:MAG: phosphonoacetaldehyde hydrolase [Hyphomicrobiales bacterium]|nr:phosphonoacetaldehyde hydrolase [Hyphomicrobiales bacterium]MCY4048796.1 phosphonoacetaldehyde hydrolase [Hyphomicrobiales bacterium]MCY4052917.1 phosphonoacetaldehyde hydrolase [Hyphomicrobiales bacterium]
MPGCNYRGGVRGVVLDWSGTTVDAYVLAPAKVFVEVFRKHGVVISMSEARAPMGLRKDLHIAALLEEPGIRARWHEAHGREPTGDDVARMYSDFVPMQLACLREHAGLLPGAAETVRDLQARGVKVGCTTGFTRAMVDILEEETAKHGYVLDASVAGDEVANGVRPRPFMLYRNLELMDVHPICSVVKVDDTTSGIGEALEAGCWGVGVARYSNYMDVDSLEQANGLPEGEIAERIETARGILKNAGAHYVVDSLANLPEVIEDIEAKLSRGENP